MHEELVKALLCCVTDFNNIQSRLCNKCPYAKYADGKYGCENKLKADAAEAIEELISELDACKTERDTYREMWREETEW